MGDGNSFPLVVCVFQVILPYESIVLCMCSGNVLLDIIVSRHYKFIIKHSHRNGVLRKLKHIFPNTYQRIKSICSPAKGGTGCYRFNYQPGS